MSDPESLPYESTRTNLPTLVVADSASINRNIYYSGSINLVAGSGIAFDGKTISNTSASATIAGVVSVNSQTGTVNITPGPGMTIDTSAGTIQVVNAGTLVPGDNVVINSGTVFVPLYAGPGLDFSSGTYTNIGTLAPGSNVIINSGSVGVPLYAGPGMAFSSGTYANTGVLSLQGNVGAVNLTAGQGISISGLTITNTGTLEAGSGLEIVNGTIVNTGQTVPLSSGTGIQIGGGTVANIGVITVQDQTGNVTLAGGNGIDINGSTIINSAPLYGVGSGLSLASGTVINTGVLQVQGLTGDVSLVAGSGISIGSNTIVNTGQTTALNAGPGISIANSTITNIGTLAPGSNVIINSGSVGVPLYAGPGMAFSSGTYANTGVLSFNGDTGSVTASIPSPVYALSPYHGAYPYVMYSPFYQLPSRVGGIYINAISATVAVGTEPDAVAITPNGKYVYVANSGSNNVSVIEVSTNSVIATIGVGTEPYAVAITPDGKYAYVADFGTISVSVIDVSTNAVSATVTVGTNPVAVAITPDGKYAYVANKDSSNVSVIEVSTNAVSATVTVETNPDAVAITPDGKYAYVGNEGQNNVSVIDVSTNSVIATIGVGTEPVAVAITPDGKYAYVVNGGSNNVSVIEVSTNSVITTIGVGALPGELAITPDGKYAYVPNYSPNNVSVIDVSTNSVIATIGVGTEPYAVAITPDGKYAYVANFGSNNVSVIDLAMPSYGIQDLNVQTSTSTTAPGTSIGSITFTAGYTGVAYLSAIVRGSNNTVGDGITIGLYNGSTLLDSQTYTQEGLASNDHTFALKSSLNITAGTTYTIYVYILAVTGGTVSAKLVSLQVGDQVGAVSGAGSGVPVSASPSSTISVNWINSPTGTTNIQAVLLNNGSPISSSGAGYVTVSAWGQANNSTITTPNNGFDFGPDTPNTQNGGLQQALQAIAGGGLVYVTGSGGTIALNAPVYNTGNYQTVIFEPGITLISGTSGNIAIYVAFGTLNQGFNNITWEGNGCVFNVNDQPATFPITIQNVSTITSFSYDVKVSGFILTNINNVALLVSGNQDLTGAATISINPDNVMHNIELNNITVFAGANVPSGAIPFTASGGYYNLTIDNLTIIGTAISTSNDYSLLYVQGRGGASWNIFIKNAYLVSNGASGQVFELQGSGGTSINGRNTKNVYLQNCTFVAPGGSTNVGGAGGGFIDDNNGATNTSHITDVTFDNCTFVGCGVSYQSNTTLFGYVRYINGSNPSALSGALSGRTPTSNNVAITVGASPFTYTNMDGFEEDIVVSGGAVTAIAIDGISTSLAQSIFTVGVGHQITVTYTTAPTMTKVSR